MEQESKKLVLLRVLHILEYYSDSEHPLTQDDIVKYLEQDYGIVVERKAVGRQLLLLKEAYDYPNSPIVITSEKKRGTYIEQRAFEDSELRMLIDGVLSSKYITAHHSKRLIDKLCSLSNKYFRSHVKNVYSVNDWSKTDNYDLFYNVELIDEAIERGRRITFDYNKYRANKTLKKTSTQTVSPYQLILHNQRYYLMCYNEKYLDMRFYRLDHITNMQIEENEPVTPLRSLEGYKNGIDYKELSTALPYMYTDKIETVEFITEYWVIDQVIDWFGMDVKIERAGDKYKVSVRVSPQAMEYWAMQYLNTVEIVSPLSLREKLKENLKKAMQKYKD